MPNGLQIYNADGTIKLDATKQFPRLVGTMTLNGNGSITATGLGYPNNKLWYLITSNISPAENTDATPVVRITDNGIKILWQNQVGTTISYGVY